MTIPPPTALRSLAASTRIFVSTCEDALAVVRGALEGHPDLPYGELADTLTDALRAGQPGTPARLQQVLHHLLGETP